MFENGLNMWLSDLAVRLSFHVIRGQSCGYERPSCPMSPFAPCSSNTELKAHQKPDVLRQSELTM